MKAKENYHHGDLRAALIAAGETVLGETGVEGFSLRAVAKRVGVSHSAPAHHFGDAEGLLSALAAEGFRRFLAAMKARQAEATDEPRAQLVASGLGYFDFAQSAPALFRLMFASRRAKNGTPEQAAAGEAAFRHLVEDVARLRGVAPEKEADLTLDVTAVWSMVHGFAELFVSGRMTSVQRMAAAEREALLKKILDRAAAG